jgi:hypothetical protein
MAVLLIIENQGVNIEKIIKNKAIKIVKSENEKDKLFIFNLFKKLRNFFLLTLSLLLIYFFINKI